jgi:hypothetical protein
MQAGEQKVHTISIQKFGQFDPNLKDLVTRSISKVSAKFGIKVLDELPALINERGTTELIEPKKRTPEKHAPKKRARVAQQDSDSEATL